MPERKEEKKLDVTEEKETLRVYFSSRCFQSLNVMEMFPFSLELNILVSQTRAAEKFILWSINKVLTARGLWKVIGEAFLVTLSQ